MRPIVTDGVAWSVCLSVSRSVTILIPAKTAEPIEMPLGVWTRVGPRNQIQIAHAKGQFCGDGNVIMHGKWLTERARSTILLQQNPNFGETPDPVHFSCRKVMKLCWKVTKFMVYVSH